jgi:lambda family phage portal protein
MEAEPGAARVLPGGYEFQPWEPKHPTANFAGFMKVVKRGIARAFGRSYASLTGDLADVNFSSMRTDRVREMEQSKLHQQDLLVEQLCDVVFADWVRMALLTGRLGSVSMDSAQLAGYANWMCKGWPWIDPVKDLTASTMALQQGLTSRQQLCAEKGVDYFEIVDQLAEEQQYAEARGVTLGEVVVDATAADEAPASPDGETPARTVLPLRARSA